MNCCLAFVCCCTLCPVFSCAAFGRPQAIDLSRPGTGDILVTSALESNPDDMRLTVQLPKHRAFIHVAADRAHFRWIGASNRMYPWVGMSELGSIFRDREPQPPIVEAPNSRALLMLFHMDNDQYLCLVPLAGEHSVSWLEIQGAELIVGAGTLGTDPIPPGCEVPLLAWGTGTDPYDALHSTWKLIVDSSVAGGNMAMRSEKKYPEAFEYLGWCTWEQFKKGIDERIILSALESIEESEIPVRWILIDDGHQEAHGQRMRSLLPDHEKFPRGWEPIVAAKKTNRIRWIGIWHTLLMHWKAIDANHEMQLLAPHLMNHPASLEAVIPKDNPNDSKAFFAKFVERIAQQGFDFVKMDNMSRSTIDYYGTANAAKAQKFNLRSLEQACSGTGMALMNCSAQNTIGLLNAKHSATMRTSPDYKKGHLATSKSQILQSTHNASWLGQTFWPDHDMFHSSDTEVAKTMAVTKAMSGGPIYLSDDPSEFRHDVIGPLCYCDGLLIRPDAPGVPVPESLFTDALYDVGHPFKVVAPLRDQTCVIAAYNLSLETSVSRGAIMPSDYQAASAMLQPYEGPWQLPEEGLVVYDWDNRRGKRLTSKGLDFEIDGFGHRLFILSPIRDGWAVVGRADKFLSPATVEVGHVGVDSISLGVKEPGPIVIYLRNGVPEGDQVTVQSLGEGLYLCSLSNQVASGESIRLRREY